MAATISDTTDLSLLASSLLSATPPASLIKPLRRSDSLLSLEHEEWMERATALTDHLDQLLAQFTTSTSSLALALHGAFLLLARGPSSDAPELSLDTLESAVLWRLPAARQAQAWLTAYVLSVFPSLVASARPHKRARKLPQEAVDPAQLYDRLAHGMQVVVDSLDLTGVCGFRAAEAPVVRFKAGAGYLGAHQGVYWADQSRGPLGVYAFVHSAADADEWRWDMKGLGWRLHPVVVDGEVVFEIECAGEGLPGCDRGGYLAVVDGGVGRWVGVVAKDQAEGQPQNASPVTMYWRILPSPGMPEQVVLERYVPKGSLGCDDGTEPMYLSVANQGRRDAHSMYMELTTDSPASFEVQALHG